MEFGFQTSGSWTQLKAAVRWAAERDVAAFALPDHYFAGPGVPMYDALAQLAALAATTADSNMELVALASPVTFRHPAVLAKVAATINDIAPGRLTLGIGTGWHQPEHDVFGLDFEDLTTRYERLDEQLAYVAAVLSREQRGFDGSHYHLEETDIEPVAPEVRLLVGGVGPRRTPRLAGRHAHEYNAYPGDDFAARIDRMREAAAEAGRDPDDILISSAGAVVVGADEAAYEARLARLAKESGTTVADLEAHFAKRRTPRGDAERVRAQLAEMEAAGMRRFYVQSLGSFDRRRETETWELLHG